MIIQNVFGIYVCLARINGGLFYATGKTRAGAIEKVIAIYQDNKIDI